MALPSSEIANVARIANKSWPALLNLHHCLIQANREKDHFIFFAFPGQCSLYLLLNPLACHRMLRQDQQELIVKANGFVDTGSDLCSYFQIFGRIPATNAFAL